MKVDIKSAKDYWFIYVTAKSGNRFRYIMALNHEPSVKQVENRWQDSRKHWLKV